LLLGLTRDEPSEHVVAVAVAADQPAMTTTDPTAIQNATGPNLICRPAWVIV
jgi:hypothetical protein